MDDPTDRSSTGADAGMSLRRKRWVRMTPGSLDPRKRSQRQWGASPTGTAIVAKGMVASAGVERRRGRGGCKVGGWS